MGQCIVTFYAGIGEDRWEEPIPLEEASEMIDAISSNAAIGFGGCTITRTDGSWHNGKRVVRERGITLTLLTEDTEQRLGQLRRFGKQIRDILHQKTVLMSIAAVTLTEI